MHVIAALKLGGSERIAIDLATQHVRWGVKPVIVAVRAPQIATDPMRQHYYRVLKEHGIPVHEIGSVGSRLGFVRLPFLLSKLISRYSPDLVHSHTDIPDFVVSGARRLRPFRIARTIHSTSLWETHPIVGFTVEQGLQDDFVIGVSQDALASYRDLRQRCWLRPSSHQMVIPNGVRIPSLAELQNKKECFRSLPLRIAFFGRHDHYKGLDILVAAVKAWRSDTPLPIELSIFSDAAFDQAFQSQAASLPCRVHLSPPIPNAAEIMPRFDVIVVPSRAEGLGLVALEALASRTPVIGTRIPGLREALPPDWPLLVPPNDPAALLTMILDVVNGRFDLGALGVAGYKHVQLHNASEYAQIYLDSYLRYLNREPSGLRHPVEGVSDSFQA
jgi:glycosyltransferase involved in cell wall biosynthesis